MNDFEYVLRQLPAARSFQELDLIQLEQFATAVTARFGWYPVAMCPTFDPFQLLLISVADRSEADRRCWTLGSGGVKEQSLACAVAAAVN